MIKQIILGGILVSIFCDTVFGANVSCCVNNRCLLQAENEPCIEPCILIDGRYQCKPAATICPLECSSKEWTYVSCPVSVLGVSYQTRCVNGVCQLRCGPGSYGVPTGNCSGCTACPQVPLADKMVIAFGSSAGGATDITECYAPAGNAYSDSSGEYTFESDCYYSE